MKLPGTFSHIQKKAAVLWDAARQKTPWLDRAAKRAGALRAGMARPFVKFKNAWTQKLSSRTKAAIGILSVPGAIAKVTAIVGAGASILHIIGPYLLGWAALSTLSMATLVTIDLIKSRRRDQWTNKAGQVVETTLLEKQELRHVQKRLDSLSVKCAKDGRDHLREARKLAAHFKKYAGKAVIRQDLPGGIGIYRHVFANQPF